MIKLLLRVDRGLARLEGWAVTLLVGAMVVVALCQVVMRNLGSTSLPAGDTLLRHAVLWVGFLGAALATQQGCHIHMDVGVRLLPAALRGGVARLFHLVSAAICLLLARAAYRFLLLDYEGGGCLAAGIPAWVAEVVLPVAFVLVAFHFTVKAVVGGAATPSRGPGAAGAGEGTARVERSR